METKLNVLRKAVGSGSDMMEDVEDENRMEEEMPNRQLLIDFEALTRRSSPLHPECQKNKFGAPSPPRDT